MTTFRQILFISIFFALGCTETTTPVAPAVSPEQPPLAAGSASSSDKSTAFAPANLKKFPYEDIDFDLSADCKEDIEQRCPGLARPEVIKCLSGAFDNLKSPCKASFFASESIGVNCETEIKDSCADVAPGRHRLKTCLRSLEKTSARCSEILQLVK